ncbi:MAG: single-stranded-DNA-specific exonuclease RecJ [Clostridia bacterium]|nr:single-stranded-DNA-specific exonuclease RecJ [Clostridia bacterium]
MLRLRKRDVISADWPRPEYLSPLMHALLKMRGIRSEEEACAFLNPSKDQIRDSFLLSDMEKAVNVIKASIEKGESICVYGDYDVDGVCASAILVSFLKSIGAKTEPYLPSRHQEGYGLNENALKEISKKHQLLVSVDCGITAVALVECAKNLGLKVVVTDHHRPEGELPDCPVVNPLLNDYPFPYLCGAGVAFHLVSALGGREKAMEYIDFAALATIADIVPLYDENRAIASIGLKKINHSPRPGIRALIDAAGLSARPLSAGNVAFQLTPRLNASGRIGDAMRAFNLITSTDMDECIRLAGELNEENARRKTLEQEAIDEAEKALSDFNWIDSRVIVVKGEKWNPGVIGLAASRLTEKYHYPSIVLTKEDDVYVGSCRSIDGIDIHDALSAASKYLVKFGGHKMAAGLTIKEENIEAFKEALDIYLIENAPQDAYIPYQEYDLDVEADDLTIQTVSALEALSPTGCGNPAPVFRMRAQIASPRPVGANGAHLKVTLKTDTGMIDGIWFRKGEEVNSLPRTADVLFQPSVSEYQGRVSVQAELRAMAPVGALSRFQDAAARTEALFQAFLSDHLKNLRCLYPESRALSAGAFSDLFNAATQGVIIVCATVEDAKNAMYLAAPGEDTDFDVTVGEYPADVRAFRAVAIAPVGDIPKGYQTVITAGLPDGLVNATFHLDAMPVSNLFMRMPTLERLRSIYAGARRITKRPYYFSSEPALIRSIAEETDLNEITVSAGLCVLEDMHLLYIRKNGNQAVIEIPEMVKKNPEENELFIKITSYRNCAAEGGGRDE